MSEIVKRLVVARGKPGDLGGLLFVKGFWNSYDGWRNQIDSYERVTPCKPREIDVVFFRPTEEEHDLKHRRERVPPVFARRRLRPASLFELLGAMPDLKHREQREAFIDELGKDFFLFAHGHTNKSFLGYTPAYFEAQRGHLSFKSGGLLTSHGRCWYTGYKIVRAK